MTDQFVALTLLILALLFLILRLIIIGFAQKGARPPLSKGRIASEYLAGVAGGIIVAIIPAALLLYTYPIDRGNDGESWRLLGFAFMYLPVGYAIGSVTGVYLAGKRGNATGSFWKPLICSLVVAIVGYAPLFFSGRFSGVWLAYPVLFFAVPAVATIMFDLTRKYKSSTPR